MSQMLITHTFGECCALSPKPVLAFSIAAHSRFAKAEEVALRLMQSEALQLLLLGYCKTSAAHLSHSIPSGSSGEKALVQYLFDSLYKNKKFTRNFLSSFVLLL